MTPGLTRLLRGAATQASTCGRLAFSQTRQNTASSPLKIVVLSQRIISPWQRNDKVQRRWRSETAVHGGPLDTTNVHASYTKNGRVVEDDDKASKTPAALECPRNAVGVQLLSASLHSQLFPPTAPRIPEIQTEALSLSQHHLKSHGLEPEQASSLPPIAFDLPALQGKDLEQHFWALGRQAAQPWLGMAHNLAATTLHETLPTGITLSQESGRDTGSSHDQTMLDVTDWLKLDPSLRSEFTPRPPKWLKKSGWVRYPVLTSKDGDAKALGHGEPVEYPLVSDGSLSFDIEMMVQESQFAVMATAAGERAWYAWLSPWLLQEGERKHEKDHLIPFGPDGDKSKQPARLVIGHNVGFDRARVRDEYSLERTNIRWLDTMSLHAATHGISSPQRGAWIKHSKSRVLQRMLEKDDMDREKRRVVEALLGGAEVDEDTLAEVNLDDFISQDGGGGLQFTGNDLDVSSTSPQAQTWKDIASKNSLADVARLHCNIELSKDSRNAFVDGTSREEILDRLDELLTYCANDTLVAQKIFKKVWPSFIKNCPNPVTTAGVLGLGSAILPVDDEWPEYLTRCEKLYEESAQEVRDTLVELAEALKERGTRDVSWGMATLAAEAHTYLEEESRGQETSKEMDLSAKSGRAKLWWESDPWARQLDWTPKKPKKAKLATDDDSGGVVKTIPRWYKDKVLKGSAGVGRTSSIVPAILRLHREGLPVVKRADGKWVAKAEKSEDDVMIGGSPLRQAYLKSADATPLHSIGSGASIRALACLRAGAKDEIIRAELRAAADDLVEAVSKDDQLVISDVQLQALDWTAVELPEEKVSDDVGVDSRNEIQEWWPKWYWDLYKASTGQLEVTIRSKIAPLLLRLTWQGCPLHHSREHGWIFRYDPQSKRDLYTRQKPLKFRNIADRVFREDIYETVQGRLDDFAKTAGDTSRDILDPASITPVYYKVPHAAGDDSNVGSPFAKGFIPLFEKGILQSEHPDERGQRAAKSALDTNARCSYWIGVRDRVAKQMVVWDGQGKSDMKFPQGASGARQGDKREEARKKGLILPPVVPMGTVTRRAIEKTWLTASNAKKNRVGSELKAMVKAPPGWSIVGADVDSQELWICSVMGDAQFGFHGATAVGWMTLEGSKNLGTDLHSKTASILGTDRNQAKVFNYSRIYGAGIRHSSQLLLKATPDMSSEEATRKAKELYANTKGQSTKSNEFFGRKFWYGGTESFVFNKLEAIALDEQPKTPALDCGVTAALTRKYLPIAKQMQAFIKGRPTAMPGQTDFMPSRVNWVVQSSGVDYLHLLITAMEYLLSTYDIQARFMISVHDEVRYLARDEDATRTALALQIANIWTRAMFAHKLQMESLPQGVAFFAQVDIDKVLRKEADDSCVTPSHPNPLPHGKAIDIYKTLEDTQGGTLRRDGESMRSMPVPLPDRAWLAPEFEKVDFALPTYKASKQQHRSSDTRALRYLQAQASEDINEIAALEARLQVSEKNGGSHGHSASSRPFRSASFASKSTRPSFPANPRSSSPSVAAKFHTSSQADTHLPPSMQAIVEAFPPRPRKLRVPFYHERSHKLRMKWQVYRKLLQGCDQKAFPYLFAALREEMRSQKHNTSPRQTAKLEAQAAFLIDCFAKARTGDKEARVTLDQRNAKCRDEQHERRWLRAEQAYLAQEAASRKQQPRMSGALLPPSLFNGPLPRFKPAQPLHITMMIKKRRLARQRRQEVYLDSTERLDMLHREADFWVQAGVRTFGSPSSWKDELDRSERSLLNASFGREHQRAHMVFSTRMLRASKLARRAKIRSRIRRKRILASIAEKEQGQ